MTWPVVEPQSIDDCPAVGQRALVEDTSLDEIHVQSPLWGLGGGYLVGLPSSLCHVCLSFLVLLEVPVAEQPFRDCFNRVLLG